MLPDGPEERTHDNDEWIRSMDDDAYVDEVRDPDDHMRDALFDIMGGLR